MTKTDQLLVAMMEYDRPDARRIQHFVKGYEFARLIGLMEGLDEKTQEILEAAAIVHDIGIHKAEEKYGRNTGKYQEIEGPGEARALMSSLGWAEDVIERVAYLVGHHHTLQGIDGLDYQILIEADYLVNADESQYSRENVENTLERVFRTRTGIHLLKSMYLEG